MSALEQPFIDAIGAGKIEGAVLEGRSTSNKAYSKAMGNRTLPDGTVKPLESSSILFLASATKLLTTIAVLQCCEKGLLSLDADQRPQLPEIEEQGVLTYHEESSDIPVTKPLEKPLTLRHLLTHSSGLVYPFIDPRIGKWREAHPEPKPPFTIPQRFAVPLAFQPGEGWGYGASLDVAGHLVEQASGLKLDEYIRKNLLQPIGIDLQEVSFFPMKEGLSDRMPECNPKDPHGRGYSSVGGHTDLFMDGDDNCYGGHGGYATARAYVAILHSIVSNDGKLLKSESVAEVFKPQLEPGTLDGYRKALQSPMGFMFAQSGKGKDLNYGLSGVYFGEDDEAGLGKGSLAWGGGINSAWLMDPSRGICGFVAPQLGLPSFAMTAKVLKNVFRSGLKQQLDVQ